MPHHAVAARQILDQIVAYAERRLVPADPRRALHQRALELVAADRLVQHHEMPRVDDVLPVLQPVAILDHADRVIAPEAHAAQFDVVATGIDDVVQRE